MKGDIRVTYELISKIIYDAEGLSLVQLTDSIVARSFHLFANPCEREPLILLPTHFPFYFFF